MGAGCKAELGRNARSLRCAAWTTGRTGDEDWISAGLLVMCAAACAVEEGAAAGLVHEIRW